MDGVVDSHFVNFLEHKIEGTSFVRVDAETTDKLIRKDEAMVSVLTEDEQAKISDLTKEVVTGDNYIVNLEPLSENDVPALITRPEFMRRMKEMAATGGGYDFMGGMAEQYNLIINSNHPLMKKVLIEADPEKQKAVLRQAVDLAMLSQGLLKGEALTGFIKRSVEMIN
jgi:molecular chaperone HtpG